MTTTVPWPGWLIPHGPPVVCDVVDVDFVDVGFIDFVGLDLVGSVTKGNLPSHLTVC